MSRPRLPEEPKEPKEPKSKRPKLQDVTEYVPRPVLKRALRSPESRIVDGLDHAFVPTREDRRMVAVLVASGVSAADACSAVINPSTGNPISLRTLERHFRSELKHGRTQANAAVAMSLFMQTQGRRAEYQAFEEVVEKDGKITGRKTKVVCVQPAIAPDMQAVSWWERTRSGINPATPLDNPNGSHTPVVIILPSNGRGDPQIIEGHAVEVTGPEILLPSNGRAAE